jgi:hypothetical protein
MIDYVMPLNLLKYQDDIAKVQGSEAARILDEVRKGAKAPA